MHFEVIGANSRFKYRKRVGSFTHIDMWTIGNDQGKYIRIYYIIY
jgi:hypothetical protein